MIMEKSNCYKDIKFKIAVLQEINTYIFFKGINGEEASLDGFFKYLLTMIEYNKGYLEDACDEKTDTFLKKEKYYSAISEHQILKINNE